MQPPRGCKRTRSVDQVSCVRAITQVYSMTLTNNRLSDTLSGILQSSPAADQVGIEERVERLQKRSIKKEAKLTGLKLALSMIDLTTLEGADSDGKVRQLCYKAAHLAENLPDIPHVAAVCVYPTLVKIARQAVGQSGIKIAAVATGFPSGQYPLQTK